MDGASVEKRSPAPLCQKQLIPIGLIYDSQLQLSPVTQSQRKGKRSGQTDAIYSAGDRLTVAVRPGDILLLEE